MKLKLAFYRGYNIFRKYGTVHMYELCLYQLYLYKKKTLFSKIICQRLSGCKDNK